MQFTHEETYMGFAIFIDPNPDPYRPGLVWAVCRGDEELDCGSGFDFDTVAEEARHAAKQLAENNY